MVWSLPSAQFSPGNHFVPRCLKIMHPGTTYSPPVRFAPRRFPAGSRECRFAAPWAACEACRTLERGRSFESVSDGDDGAETVRGRSMDDW